MIQRHPIRATLAVLLPVAVLPVAALLFAALSLPGAARAQDASPGAFFGSFQGSGFAENRDSIYFGATVRDLDVTITPAGDGFTITWTTVIRGGGDPTRPNVRRKTRTVSFRPTGGPGVYRGAPSGDPLSGKSLVWAKIAGHTMTVFILDIDATGDYQVQSYARTLTGLGMDLLFTRIRNGETVRTARAKLIRGAR